MVGGVGFALLASVSRRREYYAYKFNLMLRIEIAYFAAVFISVQFGRQQLEPILWGLIAGFAVFIGARPRTRYIRESVKRKKRAEFELRTGKKFNPRKHEYDHEVPFAQGGGQGEANIRVVEKKKNRKKGAKSPWWDLLGR